MSDNLNLTRYTSNTLDLFCYKHFINFMLELNKKDNGKEIFTFMSPIFIRDCCVYVFETFKMFDEINPNTYKFEEMQYFEEIKSIRNKICIVKRYRT